MTLAALKEETRRPLFPSRLMQKVPTWTHAKSDCKCSWCEDDIQQGDVVVLDNEKHLTLCQRKCGGTYMQDYKGTSVPIPSQLEQNIASSKKLQRLDKTSSFLAMQIKQAVIDNSGPVLFHETIGRITGRDNFSRVRSGSRENS